MSRLTSSIVFATAVLFTAPLLASNLADSVEKSILEGRDLVAKAGVDPNAKELGRARALFDAVTKDEKAKSSERAWAHYYLALVDYRTIPAVQSKGPEAAKSHIDAAIRSAEKAIELDSKHAEAHALLSSLLGRKISLDPSLGMSLGMRSAQSMMTAKQIQPKNPRVLLLDGISKLHTPEGWGGGAKNALTLLEESTKQFAAQKKAKAKPGKYDPTWGEDEAHAWVGVTHLKLGKKTKARTSFERALEINPKFDWVRKELLPQCEE